jgi:hypothetical protein
LQLKSTDENLGLALEAPTTAALNNHILGQVKVDEHEKAKTKKQIYRLRGFSLVPT